MNTLTMCRHTQDRHHMYIYTKCTAVPTQTKTLQDCALDKDDVIDIDEDGEHAHVNIEEDAPASGQATSDYHRLLREAPDLAAIVVVFSPCVRQKRQLAQPPSI